MQEPVVMTTENPPQKVGINAGLGQVLVSAME